MPEKKKKTKKDIKVQPRDMKPRKDAKGGGLQFSRSPLSTSPSRTKL